MWPNASTTSKWNRDLVGEHEVVELGLGGFGRGSLCRGLHGRFAEVFSRVLAATGINPCCESVGEE
jgi:hypothetical protein